MSQSYKQTHKLTEKSSRGVDTDLYLDVGAVEQVMRDIVDYVERKEDLSKLPIAIDQDVPRPIRTYPSKRNNRLNSCTKEYCYKGCVCASLNEKISKRHCRKEECMFYCICKTRLLHSLRALPHRNTLVNSYPGKTSHESELTEAESQTKVPKLTETRYMRDCEERLLERVSPEVTEIPTSKIDWNEIRKSEEQNRIGMRTIQFSEINARKHTLCTSDRDKLAKIYIGRKKPIHLIDTFVWCTIHKRYGCMCHGRAFDVRTNNLLWMPTTVEVAKRNAQPHYLFNSEDYSARTFGSVFDYRARNRSVLFCEKRSVEIDNEVVTNTNSFIKIDIPPPCVDKKDSKTAVIKREPIGNSNKSQPSCIELTKNDMPNRGSVCKTLLGPETSLPIDRIIKIVRKPDRSTKLSPLAQPTSGPGKTMGKITRVTHRLIKLLPVKKPAVPRVQPGSGLSKTEDEVKIIMHDSSSDSDEEDNQQLPKFGLLCLNGTMGYIPVKEFSAHRLVFNNPLKSGEDIIVKGAKEGSEWLNVLFSSREVLDPLENKPTWVVVKRGVLKKHKPFCWDRFVSNPPVQNSCCHVGE